MEKKRGEKGVRKKVEKKLSEVAVGEKGRVTRVTEGGGAAAGGAGGAAADALRRRLMDMGIVKGAEVEVVRRAPLGDPVEFLLRGYNLTLRREEAENVWLELGEVVKE